MDSLLLYGALSVFLERYLDRPGVISGGRGQVVTVVRAGFLAVEIAAGECDRTLIAFYRPYPSACIDIAAATLEILPGRLSHDDLVIPVRYESMNRPLNPVPLADAKRTLPFGTGYSIFRGKEKIN